MAHLANNAGIQSHSAGPAFPFIVEVRERDGDPATRRYRVLGPSYIVNMIGYFNDPAHAQQYAESLAVWHRETAHLNR